jgi:hypothetical protein
MSYNLTLVGAEPNLAHMVCEIDIALNHMIGFSLIFVPLLGLLFFYLQVKRNTLYQALVPCLGWGAFSSTFLWAIQCTSGNMMYSQVPAILWLLFAFSMWIRASIKD